MIYKSSSRLKYKIKTYSYQLQNSAFIIEAYITNVIHSWQDIVSFNLTTVKRISIINLWFIYHQVFVRRPYAVGLFPLNDVFALDNYKEDEDVDHLVTMYQCLVTKEGEYHNIPQHIFSKNDSIVAPLGPRGSGIFIYFPTLTHYLSLPP